MCKKILLVDDSDFMRHVCKDLLHKEGYEVVGEAADGLQAVEQYKHLQPDSVLLDIAMPQHDGKWALQKIMEHDIKAAVIMLSAVGHAQAVVDCFMLGARGFVVKPFQGESLLAALAGAFQAPFQPLNQMWLNRLSVDTARLCGDKILSQNLIEQIRHEAQTAPSPMPSATLLHALEGFRVGEKPAPPAYDETPALLHRLIQGQDEMIALLKQLVGNVV